MRAVCERNVGRVLNRVRTARAMMSVLLAVAGGDAGVGMMQSFA
jgi:hypothetical protein